MFWFIGNVFTFGYGISTNVTDLSDELKNKKKLSLSTLLKGQSIDQSTTQFAKKHVTISDLLGDL